MGNEEDSQNLTNLEKGNVLVLKVGYKDHNGVYAYEFIEFKDGQIIVRATGSKRVFTFSYEEVCENLELAW